MFQQLSKALEILLDVSARGAYDRMLSAKKAAELRNKQLDSKRQKLKSELEERERQAQAHLFRKQSYSTQAKTPEEIFREEFERLRKDGNRLVEEEQESMRQQVRQERINRETVASSWDSSKHRIKIKWKASKNDPINGGYNEEVLTKFMKKYGDIVVLVMSPKKFGSALIEFKTKDASEMAIQYEKGNLDNPLTLEWVGTPPENKLKRVPVGSNTITDKDFESLVLRQLRQAEERKRLIEQMMQEESQEGS